MWGGLVLGMGLVRKNLVGWMQGWEFGRRGLCCCMAAEGVDGGIVCGAVRGNVVEAWFCCGGVCCLRGFVGLV